MAAVDLVIACFILLPSTVFAIECVRETVSPNEDNKGFIHSPDYPRNYTSNVCYIWYHKVTSETRVFIKIQDLDIPSIDNCRSNSSNMLFIGPHNKRQFCGSLHSDVTYETVISDYFYIVYIIRESSTRRGRGFLLYYELGPPDDRTGKTPPSTTMPSNPCIFSTIDAYGVITIPKTVLPSAHHYGYDAGKKSCSWLLQAPTYMGARFRYLMRFQNFHFFPGCCSLDIFEGSSDHGGRLVGHYFSASHPHTLYALGPQVYMKLTFNDDRYFGNFTIQFQREELCLHGYKACSFNETGCYPASKRCDGVWDCPLKGGDERGCTSSCSEHNFSCGNTSAYCFSEVDRCNGKGACANYRDEQNCSPSQCSSDKGLFLCQNKRCIYEKWKCDHANDCGDGSDEDGCDRLSSPRLIIACVVGTLCSSLLLVLALSFAMRVYALKMRRRHGDPPVRHDSPLSRIEEDLLRRRAPPPQYNEAMLTSRSFDEAYLELLNQGQINTATENSTLQESRNNNSSSSTTSSRRDRGRRSGNRRRSSRDQRLHRNLRIQRQQQHLHGCGPLLPPPPLHYFTEQPPSYSDSTSGAAAESLPPLSLLVSENIPSAVNSDFTTGEGRGHELQPMTSSVLSSSTSTVTTTEPIPPPYSLHNDLHSASSGSDDDDDDDIDDDDIEDDDDDDDDDDDLIDITEVDDYVNNNFSSTSTRVRSVNDDDCLLLRRNGTHDDIGDEEDEEDDTCLSVIPESTHSHMLSFSVPLLPPNTTISSDLMMATELGQMPAILKEDDSDDDCDNDKKEVHVVGTKVSSEESEPVTLLTREDNCCCQDANVTQSSQKEGKSHGIGTDDEDDVECILSSEAVVGDDDNECSEDTSDTACLIVG